MDIFIFFKENIKAHVFGIFLNRYVFDIELLKI